MSQKSNFIHKLSIIVLVISLITLILLFINESITEKRFNNLLDEVQSEMSNEDFNNLKVDKMINRYHEDDGIFPIKVTHLSIYLDSDPELHNENTADYLWGKNYQSSKRASFYYPENHKDFIRVQLNTTKKQYAVTYILFNIFILLSTAYYINNLIYTKKQFSYRLLLQRGLIAFVSSIILSIALALYAGVIGYMIIYLIYSLPVLIIVGIPVSLLVDDWIKRINPSKTSRYFISLGLYALFGFIGGYFFVMTFSFSSEFYVSLLTDSVYFMNIGLVAAVIAYHILLLSHLIIKRKVSK